MAGIFKSAAQHGEKKWTNKKLNFADLVFHHLAREELAAVWNVTASGVVIVHPSKYLSH